MIILLRKTLFNIINTKSKSFKNKIQIYNILNLNSQACWYIIYDVKYIDSLVILEINLVGSASLARPSIVPHICTRLLTFFYV